MARGKGVFKVNNLQCIREDRLLFSNLTFSLEGGSWLEVKGPNGSGKSSLLKILAGLLPRDGGQIFWHGEPNFCYVGHKLGIHLGLSPLENLKWYLDCIICAPSRRDFHKKCIEALQYFDLLDFQDTPCLQLSMGQRQRVALSRLLLSINKAQAPLWLLDEPLFALDTKAQDLLKKIIEQHLSEKNGMAIIVSHSPIHLKNASAHCIELGCNKAEKLYG